MDWKQLWEIVSAPDNVPIVALIPLLAFYIYLAWKQAHANDRLIAELETNPALAKTHHRKAWPFQPGWQKGPRFAVMRLRQRRVRFKLGNQPVIRMRLFPRQINVERQ